jgi:indolepyruvate ferredoxin oxidoreductase alpha subunit
MTGGQPSALPSSRMAPLLLGLGVPPAHLHVLDAHPRELERNAAILRREVEHHGLSVAVMVRECIETARAKKAIRPAHTTASEALP